MVAARKSMVGPLVALALVVGFGAAATGCTAKATVQRATPVANLKTYRQALVRGSGQPMLEWQGSDVAMRAARYIQKECGFEEVFTGEATTAPTPGIDLIVDLNVKASSRGGSGLIKNRNVAVVDVSMVLSDSVSDELLGSASIRGKSPAVVTKAGPPEQQALDIVAKQVAVILVGSGCQGARLAKAPEEPKEKEKPKAATDQVTPEQVAAAEALSDEGKKLFRGGDAAGARAKFEEAIAANPDPRYTMNLCLALESLEKYDEAIATCQKVVAANPEPRLVQKAQARIEIINGLKSGG